MQLLVDVVLHAHLLDALDVAGTRAEGEAVQHMDRLLVGRERRGVERRREQQAAARKASRGRLVMGTLRGFIEQ